MQNEADKIWEEIKNKPINMYGLPNQKVSDHVVKLNVPGEQLYVKTVSGAVLPALEEVLAGKFEVEMAEQFTIVRRKTA